MKIQYFVKIFLTLFLLISQAQLAHASDRPDKPFLCEFFFEYEEDGRFSHVEWYASLGQESSLMFMVQNALIISLVAGIQSHSLLKKYGENNVFEDKLFLSVMSMISGSILTTVGSFVLIDSCGKI